MKKRHFLGVGIATAATAGLSHYWPGRARVDVATAAAKSTNAEFEITKTVAEWRKILTPAQFAVLRQHDTELPDTSSLNQEHRQGNFSCVGCDLPLFTSATKFDSGTGWPSFYAPIAGAIGTTIDKTFLMTRVEVHCHRCGGHLGHVFEDGPPPTGQRYCMNGVAMKFIPG